MRVIRLLQLSLFLLDLADKTPIDFELPASHEKCILADTLSIIPGRTTRLYLLFTASGKGLAALLLIKVLAIHFFSPLGELFERELLIVFNQGAIPRLEDLVHLLCRDHILIEA